MEEETGVRLFVHYNCDDCAQARRLLEDCGVAFEVIPIASVQGVVEFAKCGGTCETPLPAVFDGERLVGGLVGVLKWLDERLERR